MANGSDRSLSSERAVIEHGVKIAVIEKTLDEIRADQKAQNGKLDGLHDDIVALRVTFGSVVDSLPAQHSKKRDAGIAAAGGALVGAMIEIGRWFKG